RTGCARWCGKPRAGAGARQQGESQHSAVAGAQKVDAADEAGVPRPLALPYLTLDSGSLLDLRYLIWGPRSSFYLIA
ncbi:hypothetical protein RB213_008330, partial [Colletotrichum asianum]